jgi:hypothetical protein
VPPTTQIENSWLAMLYLYKAFCREEAVNG